ncbi:MAG: large exoprotein [Microbacterium sp.]
MGGQVLGGGVVVLVAVLLWLLYLLPSIHNRARYDAAERNALRLNRALRVLAETSEAPKEVRVELTARQALAQQRAARRARADVERLERERDEIRAEQARLERERELAEIEERRQVLEAEQHRLERRASEREIEADRRAAEREHDARRRAEARAAGARLGHRADAAGQETTPPMVRREEDPVVVDLVPDGRARARRRVRLVATLIALVGVALAGWGGWIASAGAETTVVVACVVGGLALLAGGALTLRRMAQVARRASARATARVAGIPSGVRTTSALLDAADRGWTPRTLPAPLSTTSGTSAASAAAAHAAREELRSAARAEALREREERMRPAPVSIERRSAPVPAAAEPAPAARSASADRPETDYTRMGYVDDAAVEEHVRKLLAGRVAS